ncbi:MAG TPA: PAS domain-containing protein [Pelobium sp.]
MEDLIPNYLRNSSEYYVLVVDLEANYQYINDKFSRRYNLLLSDVICKPFSNSVHPEDVDICKQVSYQCILHPGQSFPVKIRKPSAEPNAYHWTSWEFSLITDPSSDRKGILCIGHDITEFTQLKKDSVLYSAKIDRLIEEISDGVIWLGTDSCFLKINSSAERILNIKFGEVNGENFNEFFKTRDKLALVKHVSQSIKEKRSIQFAEYWDCTQSWYSITTYPSKEGVTIFFRDITKEKKQANQLSETNNILSAVLDSMNNINILIDKDYKIISANRWAIETTLANFGKLIKTNTSLLDYMLEEHKVDFKNNVEKALKGQVIKFEKQFFYNDRQTWAKIAYYPTYDPDKNIIGVTLTNVDITERKLAEEALYRSETILRSLYDSTSDGCTFIDKDLRVLYKNNLANHLGKSIFGFEAEIGTKVLNYMTSESQSEFLAYYSRTLNGEQISLEKFHDEKWWLFTFFPVYNNDSEIVGIAENVKDVTQQRKYIDEILEKNRVLNQIAWEQSHLVRKPVANIKSLLSLIESEDLPEEKTMLFDLLKKSVNELDDVVCDIIHKSVKFNN